MTAGLRPANDARPTTGTLLLTRDDVIRYLDIGDCIDAVEDAFRLHALGSTLPPGVLGTHAPTGGFHVKTAGLTDDPPYYAAKINANFPRNPRDHGLPTIQGVVALFDADRGRLLALLDSIEITSLRTAAATAVAARYLAREDARTVTVVGCGVQGRSQLRALLRVRRIDTVYAYDADPHRATAYALDMSAELGVAVQYAPDVGSAVRRSDIVVTCTPSRRYFVEAADAAPGTFFAAVGADSEDKQELDPRLLASSTVVVDVLEQCATIGELHHALAAGVMTRDGVHADLAEIVSRRKQARRTRDEVIVFDSTGTALEDVAAAVVVYERACQAGHAASVSL